VAVTIPGGQTTGSPNITLSLGTGDILHLAQQIGALLATVQGAGGLTFDSVDGAGSQGPGVSSPSASELIIANTSPLAASIPGGWTYVVQTGPAPATLTGTNVDLIPGTVGGVFNVSGNSTVAANGGNNTVNATGTYLLSFGPGNDFINASGVGTIATSDAGAGTVVATGANLIESFGTGDLINAVIGSNTVDGAGSNSTITGASGDLTINITGTGEVIQPNGAALTGTLGGSGNLIYPGTSSVDVTITGSNDTLVGSSGPTTVDAVGSGVIFGGTGALTSPSWAVPAHPPSSAARVRPATSPAAAAVWCSARTWAARPRSPVARAPRRSLVAPPPRSRSTAVWPAASWLRAAAMKP
jgi:hypothetical protein